jgi:hypothetical protein
MKLPIVLVMLVAALISSRAEAIEPKEQCQVPPIALGAVEPLPELRSLFDRVVATRGKSELTCCTGPQTDLLMPLCLYE